MSRQRAALAIAGGLMLVVGVCASTLVRAFPARVPSQATAGAPSTSRLEPDLAVSSAAGLVLLRPAGSLALTPPMGWNGYNHFGRRVTAAIVEAAARTLVSSGLAAAGYTYVNLDGGWDVLQRDAAGMHPDPRKFPHGIKPVADYVHSLGLKFGIYTSAGTENCAGTSAGSLDHYGQDAATFASWGVDYVKLDWCHIPYHRFIGMSRPVVSQMLAVQMGRALAATRRPIIYDVNDTTSDAVWDWAPRMAHLWRVSTDIQDNYASLVRNFTHDVAHFHQAGRGRWNDPDMLEIGNGGMSNVEYQAQFSLWAEMSAPLIAGNDLTVMSAATRAILGNAPVIAVDQDPLGRQCYPVRSAGGLWVLTKPLANGDRAVVLFNEANTVATISTSTSEVGLGRAAGYTLLNLWTGKTTTTTGGISTTVGPHAVVMYRVAAGAGLPAAVQRSMAN